MVTSHLLMDQPSLIRSPTLFGTSQPKPKLSRRAHRLKPLHIVNSTVEEAYATAEQAMNLLNSDRKEELLSLMPDEVLDHCLDRKRQKLNSPGVQDVTFEEILAFCRRTDFAVDAYAMRAVVLGLPAAPPTMLSTLKLQDDRCLHRFAVTTGTGEELTLKLDLKLQETLEPRYRGVQFVQRWFLRGITGEPADPTPPDTPSPLHGPEAVVLSQLQGLKTLDIDRVFSFASPTNQASTGPVEKFAKMLQTKAYEPLLQHTQAEILSSTQLSPYRCFVTVGITAAGMGLKHAFCWVETLQKGEGGKYENCWMTDSVFPVSGSHMSHGVDDGHLG